MKKSVFVRFIGKQKIVLQDKLFDITDETFTNYLTCLFYLQVNKRSWNFMAKVIVISIKGVFIKNTTTDIKKYTFATVFEVI